MRARLPYLAELSSFLENGYLRFQVIFVFYIGIYIIVRHRQAQRAAVRVRSSNLLFAVRVRSSNPSCGPFFEKLAHHDRGWCPHRPIYRLNSSSQRLGSF